MCIEGLEKHRMYMVMHDINNLKIDLKRKKIGKNKKEELT
jgi:hypothetical protein